MHNCDPAAPSNNRECFQNCLHSEFLLFLFFSFFFFSWRQNLRERIFAEQEFSRLSSSTVRSYRRMLSWFSLYIIYYMCIPISSRVPCARAQEPRLSRSLFNILMSPFTLIMSLHLVTADARYSLSWGSLLLDEPVTRSLFVILILLSRDWAHSEIKTHLFGIAPTSLSLVEIVMIAAVIL